MRRGVGATIHFGIVKSEPRYLRQSSKTHVEDTRVERPASRVYIYTHTHISTHGEQIERVGINRSVVRRRGCCRPSGRMFACTEKYVFALTYAYAHARICAYRYPGDTDRRVSRVLIETPVRRPVVVVDH